MKLFDLETLLRENAYPGRGIVLGRSADNACAVMVYFIMGRSQNSRNRIFSETEDGIRTEAADPAKMVDPSLIIYHPVRELDGVTIVTNGDQTDTVRDALVLGGTFESALRTRTFEPDAPNYTPRISGVMYDWGDYALSILKSVDGDPAACTRQFFEFESPLAGTGHFLHTYMGDGSPLPSFSGEPEPVAIDAPDAETLSNRVWTALNEDNKVSLFVRYLDLESGETDTVILNKYEA